MNIYEISEKQVLNDFYWTKPLSEPVLRIFRELILGALPISDEFCGGLARVWRKP
ncbi:hypothetical protein NXS98_00855 [Fontisphaera persica]|uniref:hypothetical protein n=1 Tax=Fontisphaera persica TaxID=2974023 RepID=UPI0024C0905F|nr:hypothetical protein [Fontisphaera persica]WCJ59698.1 hypothetical protein NXS98_00855 [Fontisphaera persica]